MAIHEAGLASVCLRDRLNDGETEPSPRSRRCAIGATPSERLEGGLDHRWVETGPLSDTPGS
jgi:hypothetical protein